MIIGSNEIIMFLFAINLAFIIVTIEKVRKKSFIWFFFFCATFTIFILIVLLSPGNSAKPTLYGAQQNYQLIKGIKLSVLNTFDLFLKLIKSTPFLLTNIIFISFINFEAKIALKISPAYFACLYALIILLALFPVYYSLGNFSFYRTTNVLLLFLIIGWFLTQFLIYKFYNISFQANRPFKLIVSVLVICLILISLRQKNNITTAYADIIKGRAYRYNIILNDRYKLIDQTAKGALLMVDSISIIPKTIYLTDINQDSTYWYTKCYSGYFKRNIILK
jgi:hypothetical protein